MPPPASVRKTTPPCKLFGEDEDRDDVEFWHQEMGIYLEEFPQREGIFEGIETGLWDGTGCEETENAVNTKWYPDLDAYTCK
ncbi:hypothetical protein THAOC_34063, partial [Thalassiosira oceanica]